MIRITQFWGQALGLSSVVALVACTPNELGHLKAARTGDLSAGPVPLADYDDELSAACGDGGWTTAGEARLDRAPYLQQVSDRSAIVVWTVTTVDQPHIDVISIDDDALMAAEITTEVAIDTSAEVPEGSQIVARISGLEPETLYCYEIGDITGALYYPIGFRTAPATGKLAANDVGDGVISFVALGDLGKQSSDQYAVKEQMQRVSYDFGLLTGDIAYDDGELFAFERNYFSVYNDIIDRVPFFPASGNHDYKTNSAGPYRDVFVLPENGADELYYSFDWGSVHIAIIDTEKMTDEQMAWLDDDLARTAQPWKIVVGHRPPYSSGYHGSDRHVRQLLSPILERQGVQLALFGHDHNYERTNVIEGVTYIVTGGGGIGTRPTGSSDFTAHSNQVAHFVYGEISADSLTLWAVDAAGQTFDTAVLRNN